MYGGGGTPLGGHTPGPCQASRLPPHNPRLHAPPKHGHVSSFFHSAHSASHSWESIVGKWEEKVADK